MYRFLLQNYFTFLGYFLIFQITKVYAYADLVDQSNT